MIDANDPIRCTLAYHGIKIDLDGDIDPCCQYSRSNKFGEYTPIHFTNFDQYQREVQQRMHDDAEAGIKHARCEACWKDEELGLKSLRQHSNQWYAKRSSDGVAPDNPIYHVQYLISNVCNLKCVMCNPWCSSLVSAERTQHRAKFEKLGMTTTQRHREYCETEEFYDFSKHILQKVRTFRMTGGEPFINPATVRVLRDVENKSEVNLSFNTNFTDLPDELITEFKKFRTVLLNVSLEGVGDKNHYIRYPSVWTDILANIDKFKATVPQGEITLHHTIQHTSVYALPELVEFAQANNYSIHYNVNMGDSRLNLNSVPPRDFDRFVEWANTADLDDETRNFIKKVTEKTVFDPDQYDRYRAYIDTLDEIRRLNYDEIFKPSSVD